MTARSPSCEHESVAATSRSPSWCLTLPTARGIAEVDELTSRILSGPQRPIVLMPRLPGAPVAESVAPHNPDLGVMLAYTPLHTLLFGLPGDEPGPSVLVMTSGNLGGEPICFTDEDALERLSHLADGWLMHDRAILVPCDDSVMRVVASGGSTIEASNCRSGAPADTRRCRSRCPLPVPPTLAVGADLKNTMAVADGKYAWLSQHIGDMDDLATLSAFDSAQRHLQELTAVAPQVLVADAHPLYRSTAWATPQRRGPAGPHGPAPPRAHRGGDGRARPRRFVSRCSGSPSTERVTAPTARSGAAR